jgi:hypothetical protein
MLTFTWLKQLCCTHPHEHWSSEEYKIANSNRTSTTISRRVLVCDSCGKIHRLNREFTHASGVFGRINNAMLTTNHWKEQESQYQDVRRTIEAYKIFNQM